MLEYLLNLQLFADGGDGGDGGATSSDGGSVEGNSGVDIPAHIPERAKKYYKSAVEKNTTSSAPQAQPTTTEPTETTEKKSYADLIKSDDYKAEHEAYMQKTINDRLKKYKGIEADFGKAKDILSIVAGKYGVDVNSENFLEALREKAEADDSYYEQYAMEHDLSTEQARQIVTMERKVQQIEAQNQMRQQEEAQRQQMQILMQNAEKTKAQFPEFDLNTEMQDERFRRMVASTQGDTTSAYMACHWNQIIPKQVQMASQQIQAQTAQAVASNKARPIENGMSSNASAVVSTDFSKMNLAQIRAYADEQRRLKR